MIDIKELLDDLGGGKTVSLGAVLCVLVYVAADRYVGTIEARLSDLRAAITTLEARQHADDIFHGAGPRFTAEQGKALRGRIERLERLIEKAP